MKIFNWIRNFFIKEKRHTDTIKTVKIQFFITKKMRMDLNALGWKKSQVDKMYPDVAAQIIKNMISPN